MQKKFLSVFLALVMVLTMFPVSLMTVGAANDGNYSGGNGTAENPYKISSREDLEELADAVNGGNELSGVYFEQTKDIDLGGEDNPWTTIGYVIGTPHPFKGVFDGKNYKITDLYVDEDTRYEDAGLFGNIGQGGVLRNINVVCGDVYNHTLYVGGIAGRNYGLIEYCTFSGYVYSSWQYAGGIVGNNYGTVRYCANFGDVEGDQKIGGIAGGNNGGTIENCYNYYGYIYASDITRGYAGGIVGENDSNGTVNNCCSISYIESNNNLAYCGGIAGSNDIGSSITNCFFCTEEEVDDDLEPIASGMGASNNVEKRSPEDFASGEIAWLLSKGKDGYGWGQTLNKGEENGNDSAPVFTTDTNRKVWRVTFKSTVPPVDKVYYVNTGDDVNLPEIPGDENAKWYFDNAEFDGKDIRQDYDAVAGVRVLFNERTEEYKVVTTYDQRTTLDMNSLVAYSDKFDTTNQFVYTFENDEAKDGIAGAEFVDNTLIIPDGVDVKEGGYKLVIKATETKQHIHPLWDEYPGNLYAPVYDKNEEGSEYVLIHINVIIEKATPIITELPTTEAFDYGKTLDEVALTGGEAEHMSKDVPGTFSWANKDTVPNSGTSTYIVDFKPNDTNNFNSTTAAVIVTVNKVASSVTKVPEGIETTYNGNSQNLVIPGEADGGTLKYSLDKEGEYSSVIPAYANAGEYKIWYKVVGDDNHDDTKPASLTSVINKVGLTIKDQTVTYNGDSNYIVTLDGVQGRPVVAALDPNGKDVGEYTYNADPKKVKDNEYTVTLSNENYYVTEAGTLKIEPLTAILQWSDQVVFNHDGKEHEVTAEVTNAMPGDEFKLEYKDNKKTDIGDYTATVEKLGNGNYVIDEATKSQMWHIVGEDIYVSMKDAAAVYGDDITLTVEVTSDDDEVVNEGTVEFFVNGDNSLGTASVENGIATLTVEASSVNNFSAGPNAVKASYEGDSVEDEDAYATAYVEPKPISAQFVGDNTKTYDGNNVATGITGIEPDSNEICGKDQVSVTADAYVYNSKNVEEAKTITAVNPMLTGAQAANYVLKTNAKGNITADGSINPKTVKLVWTGYNGLVYDGKKKNVTATATELIPGDIVIVKVEGGNATNAGNYEAKAVDLLDENGNHNGNYALPTDGTAIQKYTIAKADPSYSNIRTVSVIYREGMTLKDIAYILPNHFTWDKDTQKVGDVGEKAFPATYNIDSPNYNAIKINVPVTVVKTESAVELPKNKNVVYNGNAQELVTLGEVFGGELQYSLSKDKDYGITIPKGTDAGEYTVWCKVVGDNNHNDLGPEPVAAKILKSDPTIDQAPVAVADLRYNKQNQTLLTAGTAYGVTADVPFDGKVVYSADNRSYSTAIPTGKNAGTYIVWYKVIGDKNHNDSAPVSVTVTIAKGIPEYTIPSGLTATEGDKLAYIALPIGFTWDNRNESVGEAGVHKFTATYTPDDPNYDKVSVIITVTVNKAPNDEFRCSMCDKYEENKDKPFIGFFYKIFHSIVHAIENLFH